MDKLRIGIDLGTTNTVCCRFDNSLEFVKFRGKDLLPSVLFYRDGKTIVGESAKKKAITYPNNSISSAKTFMGADSKKWTIEDRSFTPTEVAAEVLKEVAKEVYKTYNVEECAAVITVPAYFTSKQYMETEKAAQAAGIEVLHILPEPAAAAIAYGIDENTDQNIFIIDLGGGTFDVSILKIDENEFTEIGTDGDRCLGGDDFDKQLVEMCLKQIRVENGINLASEEKSGLDSTLYAQVMKKLQSECEKAKVELSATEETDIVIPSLIPQNSSSINFSMHLTRADFEEKCEELLERIEDIIERCLDDADYDVDDIDKVILVGGSSNIPAVKDLVVRIFNKTPYADKDLSKLVAIGAAIKAVDDKVLIKNKQIKVNNILSHSFGVAVADDDAEYSIIIPKGTKYPCEETKNYTTVSDYQKIITVKVYEGEDIKNIENDFYYDEYEHDDIEQAPKGVPSIQITFSFDKNRVLHVKSKDSKGTREIGKAVKVK